MFKAATSMTGVLEGIYDCNGCLYRI